MLFVETWNYRGYFYYLSYWHEILLSLSEERNAQNVENILNLRNTLHFLTNISKSDLQTSGRKYGILLAYGNENIRI